MKGLFKRLYYGIYAKLLPTYSGELEKVIMKGNGCRTLLDVGCGENSPIQAFSDRIYSVGIDVFSPAIKESRRRGIHNRYHRMNIMEIGKAFKRASFDCVFASDVIEHLSKRDGVRLLKMMEKIAAKRIIVFTTNGFYPHSQQDTYDDNPWQLHKSGWTCEEMRMRGYDVIGINGWKALRCKFKRKASFTKYLWMIASDITQIFLRNHPKHTFHILCVKDLTKPPEP